MVTATRKPGSIVFIVIGSLLLVAAVIMVVVFGVVPLFQAPAPAPSTTTLPPTWYQYSQDASLWPTDAYTCPNSGSTGHCWLKQDDAVAACNADPTCIGLQNPPVPNPSGFGSDMYQLTRTQPGHKDPSFPWYNGTFFYKKPTPISGFQYVNQSTITPYFPSEGPGEFTCPGSLSIDYCRLSNDDAIQACNSDPLCTGLWDPATTYPGFPPRYFQLSRQKPRPVVATDGSLAMYGKFYAKSGPTVCTPGYTYLPVVRVHFLKTIDSLQLTVTIKPGNPTTTAVLSLSSLDDIGGDVTFPQYPSDLSLADNKGYDTDVPTVTLNGGNPASPYWAWMPSTAPPPPSGPATNPLNLVGPAGALLPGDVPASLVFQASLPNGVIVATWNYDLKCNRPPFANPTPVIPVAYELSVQTNTPDLFVSISNPSKSPSSVPVTPTTSPA